MSTADLMAISPLDGRYADKVSDLRPIFSEYGLMKCRVQVEIRWLQMLAAHAKLPELPPFSHHAQELLNGIIDNFSEQDAARIKHIESGINHDVKAVEYFIKEKLENNARYTQSSIGSAKNRFHRFFRGFEVMDRIYRSKYYINSKYQ